LAYEIKFDGYRIMTRVQDGEPRLITRGGHDWTSRMAGLAADIRRLKLKATWLDGEIVVLGPAGVPDFNALQNAFDRKAAASNITYFVFDLPFYEGRDLRGLPLSDRRALLASVLEKKGSDQLRFSADFVADPASILQSACKMGLEGLIAKRADAPYVSDRTETWLKLKCRRRQEFVIAGFTDRGDVPTAREVGSLLLGVHDAEGQLVSAGSVGTGWDSSTAADLKKRLVRLEEPTSPFSAGPAKPGRWSKRVAGTERWVKPQLVAEVSFAEWTLDGQVRHATFVALRSDKPARAIQREVASAPAGVAPVRGVGQIKVSNPERVIDASTGLTKLDLVRHYESVAEWMLPHLKGRPISLVRGPTGVGGELFFQKHDDKLTIQGLKELDPGLWPGHPALLEVPTAAALANAAQMNVIEFHTWNAVAKAIDRPDRMIFDLDPGDGCPWAHVQEAAVLVRTLLTQIGLDAWIKTSGGKGLHVVVPVAPRLPWDTVKDFSQAVVQHLAKVIPSRFVAKSGPANRVGKIFVDYLRNSHGATTAAAFSARARPGLGVSMPISWEALSQLKSGAQWNIATAREHLSFQTEDPWKDYWTSRQTLTAAMKVLGFKPKA
jgi:bifunctional non-homologous end joining protein LigD